MHASEVTIQSLFSITFLIIPIIGHKSVLFCISISVNRYEDQDQVMCGNWKIEIPL